MDQPPSHGQGVAVHAWQGAHVVREGYLTAAEAIDYMSYFYEFMAPLTPVLLPVLSNPKTHVALLAEDPVLAISLLTIASRYHIAPGIDGLSRSRAVHQKLWDYLRGLIKSLMQSEDLSTQLRDVKAVSSPVEETENPTVGHEGLDNDGVAGLGAIESLLLLTDWHPRGFDSLLSEDEHLGQVPSLAFQYQDPNGWTDEVSRSDRTSSMVLSLATRMAHSLGVFDAPSMSHDHDEQYHARASRLKALLHIYSTQLSTRLNRTSTTHDDATTPTALGGSSDPSTSSLSPLSTTNVLICDESLGLADQVNSFWMCITSTVDAGTQTLFPSRQHTTELIRSGGYVKMMQDFAPTVTKFRHEFRKSNMPPLIKHVLAIEFEYMRMHINSLALQAVTERYLQKQSFGQLLEDHAQLHLDGCTPEDWQFVRDIANGCRSMLQAVVYGLIPGNHIRHTPIRIYFRIASGIMLLFKTFLLGAPLHEVNMSIDLVNATVEALQNCGLDEAHLASRLVHLLKPLPEELRGRFMPVPAAKGNMGVADAHLETYVTSVCSGLSNFCESSMDDLRQVPENPDSLDTGLDLGTIGAEGLNSDWLEML